MTGVLALSVDRLKRWLAPRRLPSGPEPVVHSPASVSILHGGEVALEVLQAIGYRTVLKEATIVSYNMQDYEFWGQGTLSHLLLRQLSFGASIRLMTTPPPDTPNRNAFKDKYALLKQLVNNGVTVYVNEKLHAKAYLFLYDKHSASSIVGSPNLTGPGFGLRGTPADSLVEMAAFSEDRSIFELANTFVDNVIVSDARTEEFSTWFARNSMEIGKAGL
jgi:hypothetical protein